MSVRKKLYQFRVHLFVLLPLLLVGIFFATVQVTRADDFLKFHWKFDEGTGTTAGDASGNTPSYPGTLYGGASWLTGGGLSFDGVNDYTRTNSAIPNSMGVSDQAYTLSASVRVAPGEQNGNIIHISDGSNGVGWCISMLHIKDGRFRAIGWNLEDGNPGQVLATAPTAANTNEWYSIANTWSPQTQSLDLYVNGNLVASTPMSHYSAANANVYVFAGYSPPAQCNNTQGWFKGDVKDVRIYNRAITQEEAEDNSNASLGIPPLSITAPIAASNVKNWSPAVNWNDADECAYSFNNTDWTALDCGDDGSDIPPPGTDGTNINLYVRSNYTGEETYANDLVTFTYDTTGPTVYAGDNADIGGTPFQVQSPSASDTTSGIASYSWSKHSGPGTVTFSNTAILQPTITAVSLEGIYQLRLTVTDNAGNTSYDDFTLLLDTTTPTIELTDFPDATTTQTSATFGFVGSEDVSQFECSLDDASFNSCTTPKTYANLELGEHVFEVRSRDTASNLSETLYYSWTIIANASNDANGDGILDSEQPHISSFTSDVTGKQVVLEAEEGCVINDSTIKAERTHSVQDARYDYPEGLFNFTVQCEGDPGFTTTIKQYYYGISSGNQVLRKYNPVTNTYFNIEGAGITDTTIYQQPAVVASYQITDGGQLDTDGTANGTIVDPAGLAQPVANATDLAGTGTSTYVYIVAGTLLTLFSITFVLYKNAD